MAVLIFTITGVPVTYFHTGVGPKDLASFLFLGKWHFDSALEARISHLISFSVIAVPWVRHAGGATESTIICGHPWLRHEIVPVLLLG